MYGEGVGLVELGGQLSSFYPLRLAKVMASDGPTSTVVSEER